MSGRRHPTRFWLLTVLLVAAVSAIVVGLSQLFLLNDRNFGPAALAAVGVVASYLVLAAME